jgi:hypothetical protein
MFARKYTDAQRRAVAHAVVYDGLTAQAAVSRAASPEGLSGLPPFSMPASTARNLAWREKRSRERVDPMTDEAEWWRQLPRRLERLATRMLRQTERNGGTPQEVRAARRTLEYVQRICRDMQPKPAQKREPKPIPPELHCLPADLARWVMQREDEHDDELVDVSGSDAVFMRRARAGEVRVG